MEPRSSLVSGAARRPWCTRCSAIDLDAVFSTTPQQAANKGKLICNLGRLTSSIASAACPMCRIFADAKEGPDDENYQLWAYSSRFVFGSDSSSRRWLPASVILMVGRASSTRPDDGDISPELRFRKVILPCQNFATRTFLPSFCEVTGLRKERWVRSDRLQDMLQQCKHAHDGCNTVSSTANVMPALKMLECDTQKVVDWDGSSEYYTLSYVWGEQATAVSTAPTSFPLLIKDAMEVVKRLGGRYLWVDRYCIQQNSASKHEQIAAMGDIYERAIANIVAAASTSADQGLHGVSTRYRAEQPQAVSGKGTVFGIARTHANSAIADSVWSKRGWTYQEAILSRRCLVFSEDEVYMICRNGTYSECTLRNTLTQGDAFSKIGPSVFVVYEIYRQFADGGETRHEDNTVSFDTHLTNYSRRDLRFQSDNLSAFYGILARSPMPSLWGLPIVLPSPHTRSSASITLGFAWGLCWTSRLMASEHVSPESPISGFPTWSWTCVRDGIIFWHGIHHRTKDHSRMIFPDPGTSSTTATFSIGTRAAAGRFEPLPAFVSAEFHSLRRILPEHSQHLQITAAVVEIICKSTVGYHLQSFSFAQGDPRSFTGPDDFGGSINLDYRKYGYPQGQRLEALHILTQNHVTRGNAGSTSVLLVFERRAGGFAKRVGIAHSEERLIPRMVSRREVVTFQ